MNRNQDALIGWCTSLAALLAIITSIYWHTKPKNGVISKSEEPVSIAVNSPMITSASTLVGTSQVGSSWKVLTNKYGWTVRYPSDWSASGVAENEGGDPSILDTVNISGSIRDEYNTSGQMVISANASYPLESQNESPEEFLLKYVVPLQPDVLIMDQQESMIDGSSAYEITYLQKNEYPHGQIYKVIAVKQEKSIFTISYFESNSRQSPLPTDQWRLMPIFTAILTSIRFTNSTLHT